MNIMVQEELKRVWGKKCGEELVYGHCEQNHRN